MEYFTKNNAENKIIYNSKQPVGDAVNIKLIYIYIKNLLQHDGGGKYKLDEEINSI